MPLYCCFIDLTAAFDRGLCSMLWERLRSCGVPGRMLAAMQALYSDAHIVVNTDGCIRDSATVLSGVKQGCPPTAVNAARGQRLLSGQRNSNQVNETAIQRQSIASTLSIAF